MNLKDCRAIADQRFVWLHNAEISCERRVYLKLARAWLEDDVAPVMLPASRLQLNKAQW